ncbi:unnamed protein product [Caretta caretta]
MPAAEILPDHAGDEMVFPRSGLFNQQLVGTAPEQQFASRTLWLLAVYGEGDVIIHETSTLTAHRACQDELETVGWNWWSEETIQRTSTLGVAAGEAWH